MTPYSDIYEMFLSKLTYYGLIDLEEADLEIVLFPYLKTSISRFVECKQDLSNRDDIAKTFNITLSDIEIEILSEIMLSAWTKNNLYNHDLFNSFFNTGDIKTHSPANLMKQIQSAYNTSVQEYDNLIMRYTTYTDDFINGLK